jgi:hypothetical protein
VILNDEKRKAPINLGSVILELDGGTFKFKIERRTELPQYAS